MKINQRRAFLINPSFQLRIIGWMIGMSLAPICAFFAAHHYFFWKLKSLGEEIQLDEGHIYFRFLEAQSNQMFWIFLICSLLAVVTVAFLGLILSHRIAGPIHRLKTHMIQLTEGKALARLSFRKDDYFVELPNIINDYIESREKNGK